MTNSCANMSYVVIYDLGNRLPAWFIVIADPKKSLVNI